MLKSLKFVSRWANLNYRDSVSPGPGTTSLSWTVSLDKPPTETNTKLWGQKPRIICIPRCYGPFSILIFWNLESELSTERQNEPCSFIEYLRGYKYLQLSWNNWIKERSSSGYSFVIIQNPSHSHLVTSFTTCSFIFANVCMVKGAGEWPQSYILLATSWLAGQLKWKLFRHSLLFNKR